MILKSVNFMREIANFKFRRVIMVIEIKFKEIKMKIPPVKMAAERLNIVGQLDGYASEMVRILTPIIYDLSYYNPVKIAQKGDLLLINSGAKTSALNLKKMKDSREIITTFRENSDMNKKLNVTGRPINYII